MLIFGQRLFWLFVGGVGFWIGLQWAPNLLHGQSETVILVAALVLGLICAVLATLLQHLAVGVAGFVVGGYATYQLATAFSWHLPGSMPSWLFFVIGGIIGAVLIAALFDWALIVFSSLAGAALIVQNLQKALSLGSGLWLLLLIVLLVVGILIQGGMKRRGS